MRASANEIKSMEVLKTLKWSLQLLGYSSANRRAYSTRQIQIIFASILVLSLQCAYVFHVANTDQEYLESIFLLSMSIVIFICFVSTIGETAAIFQLIDTAENVFIESK